MQMPLFHSKNIPCLLVLVFSIIINNPAQSYAERIRKVAIMGNSFSIHPTTDYWWGEWGMAATHRDSDYCHVLQKLITNWQGEEPELAIHNIADFERGHGKDEVRQQTAEKLIGTEDLIILRIGECVSNYIHYTEDLEALIDRIKFRSPGAKIVMSGCFWPSHKRDSSQMAASMSRNCIWCPLRQLCSSETLATVDDRVFGDDYLWHFIKEGGPTAQGVANHANNKGHRLIAECLFDSIKTAWRLTALTEIVQEPASIVRTEYFDLSGRRLSDRPTEGIYIVRHIYSDGKRTNRKAIATK